MPISERSRLVILFPIFLFSYNLAANLSNDIYLPALPHLSAVFHQSDYLVQWTFTAWFAGVASPQLIFGILAEYYGRRKLALAGGGCFLTATALCIFSPNIYFLLAARFLQGVGVCTLNVATFSTLRSYLYSYEESVKLIAYANATSALAPLLGPLIGTALFIHFGWRSTFVPVLLLGMISVGALYRLMPESYQPMKENLSVIWKVYLRHYFYLLKNKLFMAHMIFYGCALGGLVAYLAASPFLLIKHFLLSPKLYGVVQLPIFLGSIFGAVLVERILKFYSRQFCLLVGIVGMLAAVSFLLMASVIWPNNLKLLIITMTIFTTSFAFGGGFLISDALELAEHKSLAAAVIGTTMALFCLIGSSLVGLIHLSQQWWPQAFIIFFMTAAGCGYYFLNIRSKSSEPQ